MRSKRAATSRCRSACGRTRAATPTAREHDQRGAPGSGRRCSPCRHREGGGEQASAEPGFDHLVVLAGVTPAGRHTHVTLVYSCTDTCRDCVIRLHSRASSRDCGVVVLLGLSDFRAIPFATPIRSRLPVFSFLKICIKGLFDQELGLQGRGLQTTMGEEFLLSPREKALYT